VWRMMGRKPQKSPSQILSAALSSFKTTIKWMPRGKLPITAAAAMIARRNVLGLVFKLLPFRSHVDFHHFDTICTELNSV
jgi:hypothetical protein